MKYEEIYNTVVEIIEENDGHVESKDTLLADTGLDSFSLAVLYLDLDDKFKCFDSAYKGETPKQELEVKTVDQLVQYIETFENSNKEI